MNLCRQQAEGEVTVPQVSVVLPVAGRDRRALFDCVVRSFLGQDETNVELVVVEQGSERVYETELPPTVKYLNVDGQLRCEEFNKAKAMNVGASAARAPYVLFHDADIIAPRQYVSSILKRLRAGWDAVRPLRFLFCLDRDGTTRFLETGGHVRPQAVTNVMQNFAGGAVAVRRDMYWDIGGYDEDFVGWGHEDVEFMQRLQTRHLFRGSWLPAIHLWHPPAPKKDSGTGNSALLEEKARWSVEERIRDLRKRDTLHRT